jgi:hypothetical protein
MAGCDLGADMVSDGCIEKLEKYSSTYISSSKEITET